MTQAEAAEIADVSPVTWWKLETFYTFNDLHGRGSQIVISSDRPPKSIATIEDGSAAASNGDSSPTSSP